MMSATLSPSLLTRVTSEKSDPLLSSWKEEQMLSPKSFHFSSKFSLDLIFGHTLENFLMTPVDLKQRLHQTQKVGKSSATF